MNKLFLSFSLLMVSSLASAAYEDHFPTYFEYCTGTQWKLQNGEEGGSPGHGFTYIHGLCKDYRSSYPQVIPCSEVEPQLREQYPHEGVGISLDKNFSNVMWVAVPGRDLTFFGDKEMKAITNEDVKEVIQKVTDLKVFQDVVHKGAVPASLAYNSPEYLTAVADATLGTEYAVNWARELHCVRIPTPKESLSALAQFLNEANLQYKSGPAYVWDKLTNNCAHLSINSSNVLGINEKIKVDQKFIQKLTNLALPSNTFLMYADLAVLAKMPSNKLLAKVLPERGFHPVQVGSLMNNYPAYPSGVKFLTEGLSVLTAPRIRKPLKLLMTPEKYEQKYMTAANSGLRANAEMWVERYGRLLNALGPEQKGSMVESYLQEQLDISNRILSTEN